MSTVQSGSVSRHIAESGSGSRHIAESGSGSRHCAESGSGLLLNPNSVPDQDPLTHFNPDPIRIPRIRNTAFYAWPRVNRKNTEWVWMYPSISLTVWKAFSCISRLLLCLSTVCVSVSLLSVCLYLSCLCVCLSTCLCGCLSTVSVSVSLLRTANEKRKFYLCKI